MEIEIVIRFRDHELVMTEEEAKELYTILDRLYGPVRYFQPYMEPPIDKIIYRYNYDTNTAGTRP